MQSRRRRSSPEQPTSTDALRSTPVETRTSVPCATETAGLIFRLSSQTLDPMTAFRVDPAELTELAGTIERNEPFATVAQSARAISLPATASATSMAIERFKHGLARELIDLSRATGSLSRATRTAAGRYRETEDSISRHARD